MRKILRRNFHKFPDLLVCRKTVDELKDCRHGYAYALLELLEIFNEIFTEIFASKTSWNCPSLNYNYGYCLCPR